MSNSKCVYYKEKEQKSTDGGITWVDTGNFRKGALISTQAAQCGSFVTEYRWTKADYVCDNANKYKGYKQQVSHDNGGSWIDTGVVDIGSLIESNSRDCGYNEQWFVLTGDNDFICEEGSKYKKKEMKYTRNSGTTWNSFNPPKFEKGDLIESNSSACPTLSMKVTYTDGSEKKFYGLSSIEENTDANKSNAKKVEIYDGVTEIGFSAFYKCSDLTSITLSDSVAFLGERAFSECSSLTGITLPYSIFIIGNHAFSYCSSLTNIILPYGLKTIGDFAFIQCNKITSITLPNSVTSIGAFGFASTNISSITIPNLVTSIGQECFVFCSKLTEVTIQALTPPALGTDAFANSGIQRIYVPAESVDAYKSADGWKDYADKIFAIGATPSMKVTYTDGTTKYFANLTSIDQNTDANKEKAKEVIIYDGVTDIGDGAFLRCVNLTAVTIPNSVTSIGIYAFSDCDSLTSLTIPNSVKEIRHDAFESCEELVSVILPNGLTMIDENTFQNCYKLTDITIPNSVTSIVYQAFSNCYSLTGITIPDSVLSIDNRSFEHCFSLKTMTVKAITPPSLGSDAIPSNVSRIYVPADSVDAYKSANGWKDYASKIQAIPQ